MKLPYIIDVTKMLDIEKIEEYNQIFSSIYATWEPFVTRENFDEYLMDMENLKKGIGDNGLKENFYWLMDDDKIVGSGSIRLNPEVDEIYEQYSGHIFYQIVPIYRKQGYGTLICHLLLEKMAELEYEEAIITCYDDNIGSISIIEANGGELIETINGDGSPNSDHLKTRRYKINIQKSLKNYKQKR